MNPYRGKPDYCFWSRSVSWCPPGHLDPMVGNPLHITGNMKIATLGSCFAQHIARHLSKSGLNYFVTESRPEGMSEAEGKARNYGVFSARYGNVYTVRQAVQLVERASGSFKPRTSHWKRGDRFVDPFRPAIEPDGFQSVEDVGAAMTEHLANVRRMLVESDVIVFTLGLTEGWMSREDGSVYPLAPGVSGGEYDEAKHRPVNFGVVETINDLERFIHLVRELNPACHFIFTVSPVPLIATFEDRHVMTSTVASKSILRAAVEEIAKREEGVVYFPSYEIITSQHQNYFEPDLRSVSELGVEHVMRVFSRHFLNEESPVASVPSQPLTRSDQSEIVCDEEEIEAALRASGMR